ncbi:VRR-NUC domain-containing protein [Haliea sp. E17]|uniref:VRR-NUC domain-containing protein n=1 Tax=Haliea sp. E17 TaxID=3401576 RepID=UPI003AAE0A0A
MPVIPEPAPPELQPLYYRDNFARLLDTVDAQYGDLLDAQETAFLQRWRDASLPAQCLYVRLVSRVGPWFREAALHYPEIGACGPPLDELLAAELAVEASQLESDEFARLATREELIRGFALAPARKAELLAALDARGETPESLCATLAALDGARIVAPAATDTVALLQLLFFGNRRQSLTDFVLSDLGVARYYPYQLDRSRRLFPSRDAVEEYLQFARLEDIWREVADDASQQGGRFTLPPAGRVRPGTAEPEPAMDGAFWRSRRGESEPTDRGQALRHLAQLTLETPAQHIANQARRDRLCNRLARELERQDELELALALYRQSETHPARERSARVMERSGDLQGALRLAETAIGDPWCEEERDAMGRIGTRLRRLLGLPREPQARDRFSQLELALPASNSRVELATAAHLSADWAAVHYVENALMNTLFGLAFWQEIFAPLPGAFNNAFQGAPTDMYQRSFYQSRKDAIEARFEALATSDLQRELTRACRAYQAYQCRWTDWRQVDEALIAAATAVIPAAHLLAIWRRMLFDPGENRRGFPDLLALGAAPGDYCLVEVKGPGDKLQESQKRWLRFFAAEGIPAAVAQVSWRDD